MQMKISRQVQITLVIVLGVVILALIGYSLINSLNPYSKNSVSVSGQSTIDVTPDLITIYFNVQTKGETSKIAEDENSEITNNLISNILANGFVREDIKTQNYNIYPEYNWENGERELIGYIATHSLKIEFSTDNTEKIGDVIDAGTNAGAGISYINFELSETLQQQYKSQAIELAAQDARLKAEAIATGFNKKVGKLVSVSMSEFGYSPWNLYSSRGLGVEEDSAEAKTITADIQPSEQEVSAYVNAVYKLR